MRCALILLLMLAVPASHAASLYVTSNAVANPSATTCLGAQPCHLDDAVRIAETNGEDDEILLVGPSTFNSGFTYAPNGPDSNHRLGVRSVGGRAVFDASGSGFQISLRSLTGDLHIEGIGVGDASAEHTEVYDDSVVLLESLTGNLSLRNVSINSNELTKPAGAYENTGIAGVRMKTLGTATVQQSSFMDNHPGALDISAVHAIVTDSTFVSNGATSDEHGDGAIRIKCTTVQFERNDVASNTTFGE